MKILFAGNSITLHARKEDIGWYAEHGMAASCKENDYVHVLCSMLESHGKTVEPMVVNISDFELSPDTFDLERLRDLRDYDADIIILRIVENTDKSKLPAFAEAYPLLIDFLAKRPSTKVFCVSSFWQNDEADRIIKESAEKTNSEFVSLRELWDEKYRATGLFEHSGVASHPSDAGMRAIAETVFKQMKLSGAINTARVYPLPEGEVQSADYTVLADGKNASCYSCRVSAIPFNREWPGSQRPLVQTEMASFVYFDMDSPTDICVTVPHDFSKAVLRPLSKGITPAIHGRNICFTVSEPGQFSLEIDGRHHNLHIFANPVKVFNRDENTLYYGAGIHEVGEIVLKSDQTLFIDAGAVVHASVRAVDCSNVSIIGHGILDCSMYERHSPLIWEKDGLVNFVRCNNVRVEGVILRDSNWWSITSFNCRDMCFDNVKTIGMWRYNTDGFDFVNSQDVCVKNCFLRNFDDVIVLKGMRVSNSIDGKQIPLIYEKMNLCNYLIENCVIWCDWGGALEFGAETVADSYSNIIFRNCNIIRNADGAMRIHSGDRALIENVLYENISVEYSEYDRNSVFHKSDDMLYEPKDVPSTPDFIRGWIYCGVWTKDMIYGNVKNITYRNINLYTDASCAVPVVTFKGVDAEHTFSNIVIDGVFLNGNKISGTPELVVNANETTTVCVK